jgi:anti-sigma B factor antagonist
VSANRFGKRGGHIDGGRFGKPLVVGDMPEEEGFALRTAREGGTVWLSLGGELDVYATPSLRAALRNVEDTGADRIVLDLRGLDFLDSSGLAVLLGAHERAAATGGSEVKLVIKGSHAVESLFETLRAGEYLDIVDDTEALTGAASASE